ncbi:MAG: phosphate starvation-inducible protein PsiF [Nitrospirae bacterium]|nr:phosphate starvation-inducible protein PsiF [Nitrospirota bacterium]
MKITSLVVLSLFLAVMCLAPITTEAAGQQNKMAACNKEANDKGLGEGKGEERKAFMKECLSAKPVKSGKSAQQEKMKACNKEAGEKKMKGDERKKFMSTCLSS